MGHNYCTDGEIEQQATAWVRAALGLAREIQHLLLYEKSLEASQVPPAVVQRLCNAIKDFKSVAQIR